MIAMFDDRLEIWNPGKLLPGITLKELKEPHHKSLHRNELIAKIFYSRKLIEGWGTGTTRMIEICNEMKMHEPEFSEISNGFMVTFWSGKKTQSLKKEYISTREQQILQILKEFHRPASSSDVKQKLDEIGLFAQVSIRTINRDLTTLEKKEIVEKIGAGRGIAWRIKAANNNKE